MDIPIGTVDWSAVKRALTDIAWAEDPATLRLKSRDFFWFSPILKETLEGKCADLVVFPRDEQEVIQIAAVAARFRVPITVRAGGTGNYGQSVPLQGGIIVDMGGLEGALWVRPGAGRFLAGSSQEHAPEP